MSYVPKDIQEKMRVWYRDKFFLYDNLGGTKDIDILRVFEYAVKRYNCKVFLVDNLMMTDFSGNDKDYYRAQSAFIGKMVDFAHRFDVHVHVHIVAHPHKFKGELTKNVISGSGDITNRADNVLAVARVGNDDFELCGCDNKITILKNRFYGRQNITIGMKFEPESKRFYLKNSENGYSKKYSWRDSNIYKIENK